MKKYIKLMLFFVFILTGNANAYIITQTFGQNSLPSWQNQGSTGNSYRWTDSYWTYAEPSWSRPGYQTDGFIITSEYDADNNGSIFSNLEFEITGLGEGYWLSIRIMDIFSDGQSYDFKIVHSPDGYGSYFFESSIPFSFFLNKEYVIESYLLPSLAGPPTYIPGTTPDYVYIETQYILQGFINIPKEVPEPTTILLFGAGLAGLAAIGRRKRN